MKAGALVAERFEVEGHIASGGMGHVYRARDRLTASTVALKLLHGAEVPRSMRFRREAEALAALSHPHIVRYVAHGDMADGKPYLAMEWLEGETLSARLARGRLPIEEALELGAGIASALGAVHDHGLIHRDLKPSNIFLEGGLARGVKLLDFGLARMGRTETELTVPGMVLGTIGYLSPEQARGDPDLDARADVFALGCVMYRALSGKKPFVGDDALSVLFKIVVEDPPPLRDLRPDLPRSVEALIARMMAKVREDRPAHASEVLRAFASLSAPESTARTRPRELTAVERKVMSLVLTREPDKDRASPLQALAEQHRGRLELLADGSSLIVFTGDSEATDLAARAARCALAVAALGGSAPVVVVSGRAEISARRLVGDLIDRAVTLLSQATGVRIDDVTAGLLGAGFTLDAGALRGEREPLDAPRTLLGKPTPCVGREREIGLLSAAFLRCVEEPAATPMLVTAPAGTGKSRLLAALLATVRRRGEGVQIWIGRGDSMSAGSAFGLIGQALRRGLGLTGSLEARREMLRARAARGQDRPEDAERIAEFLGELTGTPFPDDASVQLRAARRDPMLLGDQLRRAFEDFVGAVCEEGPLLLVLEDLQWGDLPTVKLVDAALRHLEARPFMVLAVGRPEVHEVFPDLWTSRGVQEIHLPRLPARAAERLVRDVLGAAATAEVVRGLVERADGNALYLEELIRAVAQGGGAALPETVLAMVQARLSALSAEERRVLRAASVFGQTFRARGVEALLGDTPVDASLRALVEAEVIAPGAGGEHRFRHALVREAAYGMLTDDDRALGHRLVGEHLEAAGEGDAMALAEHFERGGEPARAAAFYGRAAEQAFEGDDLEAALSRAERGLACTGVGQAALAGEILLVATKARRWLGRNTEAEESAVEAMRVLRRGSARWCEAVAEVVHVAGKLGHTDRLLESAESLLALTGVAEDAAASLAVAMARTATTAQLSAGRQALGEVLLARAEEEARRAADDPAALGQVLWARALRVLAAGNLSTFLDLVQASRAHLTRAGDLRSDCIQALNAGHGYLQLGAYAEAERILAEARQRAERMHLGAVRSYAMLNLGLALEGQGRLDEARAVAEEVLGMFQAQADRPRESIARTYLAQVLARAGEREAAAREALAVVEDRGATPTIRAYAHAVLADVRLAEGRASDALAEAEVAMSILTSLDGIEEGEALIRVVYADALDAAGERERACAAIREARETLLTRARKVRDPALYASFLERVPENARTLARAAAWLGSP